MRCGERRKVTGFLGPEIEDIKEKSRHQICADGSNQSDLDTVPMRQAFSSSHPKASPFEM